MNRYYSYLNSAKEILSLYNGREPFASFLKKYFSQHRKIGSKDRRQISHICYCYFRLGRAQLNLIPEERILTGLFLCSSEPDEMLEAIKPEWNNKAALSLHEKCTVLNLDCRQLFNIFPWEQELSTGIEHERFSTSFLIQPGLYLRLRPGNENIVRQKLEASGIGFKNISENCLELPNAVKIDKLIALNKEAVIQDLSSQRTGDLLLAIVPGVRNQPLRVWDCCTASGGKSIMAADMLRKISLTVSDIRTSILHNLDKRFAEAGIRNYKSFVADLSANSPVIHQQPFDLVIADVPCTGSGTWGRTPEQLFYFEVKDIERYASLQKRIAANTVPFLKPGGFMLYITCSVFKKENEDNVEYMLQNFPLSVKKMELIKGYDKKADTMFAALLQKSL